MADGDAGSALGGAEAGGCLLRTAAGFSVVDDDSFGLEAHEIERSRILLTAVESAEEGSHVPIRLTHSQLAQWRAYVRNTGQEVDASTAELQQILQAAEYLDDEATIARASRHLARELFPKYLMHPPPPGFDKPWKVYHMPSAAVATGVLEALPEHLAITVLRAALATVPPKARSRELTTTRVDYHGDDRSCRRRDVVVFLAEALQPLALRAADPAIDSSRSLTLHNMDAAAAAPLLRCAAANFSTHLTALNLGLNVGTRQSLDGTVAKTAAALEATAALEAVAALLPQFSGLQLLKLRIIYRCYEGADADYRTSCMGVPSVAAALPGLTRLTHLEVSGSGAGAVGQGLPQSLPALRMLCTLDLSGGMLWAYGPQHHEALASALRPLRALTRLSLAENSLRGDWQALAPAVAALPLRSLDLSRCELDRMFDLFSGCDSGARVLHELQELDLSYTYCKAISAGFLSRLMGLKQLKMMWLHPRPEVEEQLLLALLGNQDLEVLTLGNCNGTPQANEALRRFLAQSPRLRALTLSWRGGGYDAAIPKLAPRLAALPQLRDLCLTRACVRSSEDAPLALGQLRTLTSLHLQYLHCKAVGAAALAARIALLTCLCALDIELDYNKRPETGSGAALVRGLASLTRLTRLRLCDFALCPDGAARLARALQCMPRMHELYLTRYTLGPAGVRVLVDVLPTLHMLSLLWLCVSECGGEYVTALAEALPALCILSVLELQNVVGDEGAEALAGVLPRMHALRQLRLRVETVAGEAAMLRAAPVGLQIMTCSFVRCRFGY